MIALSNPQKGLPSNAAFHPTIQTVGFQTTFSVIFSLVRTPYMLKIMALTDTSSFIIYIFFISPTFYNLLVQNRSILRSLGQSRSKQSPEKKEDDRTILPFM